MALDTALKRGSATNVGSPWRAFLPLPDGAVAAADRQVIPFVYSGILASAPAGAPILLDQIPNISAAFDSGTHQYDLSVYFDGATSYAIGPAVETGWSFDTNTGILEIDTDVEDTFGPFVVTASNAQGDTDGNAFTVKVSVSTIRPYRGIRGGGGLRNYS